MATLGVPNVRGTPGVQGLQARSAIPKPTLREKFRGVVSAYKRKREEGLVAKRTGKVGKWLQDRWQGTTGDVTRSALSLLGPAGSRISMGGDVLLGTKRAAPKGQTVKVYDPASKRMITKTFDRQRVRGTGIARKLGTGAVGMAAQKYAESNPERAGRFFGSSAGRFAGGAASLAGGALAVKALRGFRDWQRAPRLREQALKEWKRSPEAAKIHSTQRAALQRKNAPIMRANVAARQRQVQQGRSAFAAREKTITPRGFRDTGRRPTITRGYNRQIGRVAPTLIEQRFRGSVRSYAGGSTAARDPYRGAARMSTYSPSTSRAAMSQRGTTRRTASGSSYVTGSGRGTFSTFKTPTRRAPTTRGSYPSRAAYRPSTPRASAPKRSYASFRSQVKVSSARPSYKASSSRSSSSSYTPFARR